MSFYIGGSFDPDDSTRLIGIAPEGSVNIYKIDYVKGTWDIEACYETGRLGDSMFPFTGSFRAVRRDGELYLYHREIPSVVRLDPRLRRAIPVAIAGTVRNRGRSMIQFAGSGRDGYPKPWVTAAEHHGFKDLTKTPKFYSWADSDGDGSFDPQEFEFYPNVTRGPRGQGDFLPSCDFLGKEEMNKPNALVRLPVARWEGPNKAAPRWDLRKQQALGPITADSHGFGSVRSICVASNESISATYQAGVMIREHGQYEGGGWPECAVKASRLLRFNADFHPKFTVGRQSKVATDASQGALYYPMHVADGPNNSVVLNDQTKQPAQVWTDDGLYVGGVFDNRANDGLPDAFYQVHGDDNQGCTVVTTNNGKTYWLMPYQGHNRLYEITGWDDWARQSGAIKIAKPNQPTPTPGKGLLAKYIQGKEVVHETIEAPTYYERFGPERHGDRIKPHYKVEWTGYITPPFTDRYQFHSLLGNKEQIAVWIDGHLAHVNGMKKTENTNKLIELTSGHRHHIHIEYINPDGRAELNLLWSSRVLDHQRLPSTALHPHDN